MLRQRENIAYDQPDKGSNPESQLPTEVQERIENIKRQILALTKEGDNQTGTNMLLAYAATENDFIKKKILTFIARTIDKLEDFTTKQCAASAKTRHHTVLNRIDEALTIAEELGLKVMEPVRRTDEKKGHHYIVHKPAENPQGTPSREVPEGFIPRKQVSQTIRKGVDYVPNNCLELLLYLNINSKNAYLLTYNEISKFIGLSESTVRDRMKLLDKYLPKIGLEVLKFKSTTNKKTYLGLAMLGGGVHLGVAFRKEEERRVKEIQKKKDKAARKTKDNRRKAKPKATSASLFRKFKMPDPDTYEYESPSWEKERDED
ncbi:hypothetical protein ACFL3T_01595 [Patescibacteria group bacterium]